MTFCKSCGSPIEPDAHFCVACGKPVNVIALPDVSHAVQMGPPIPDAHDARENYAHRNAITWPFHQANWYSSVWILLVGWFFLPLPMIISFGWLIDAAARRAHGEALLLPKPRNLLRMYRDGLVFWMALAIYFVLPLMVFAGIFATEEASIAGKINAWLIGGAMNPIFAAINVVIVIASNILGAISLGLIPPLQPIALYPHEAFAELMRDLVTEYFGLLLVYVVYLGLAYLLFLAGTLRFAATRRIGDYFRIFKNFGLVLRHLPRFLWLVVLLALLNYALGWVLITGFLGFVLAITFGVWIAAALIGNLAAKFRDLKVID